MDDLGIKANFLLSSADGANYQSKDSFREYILYVNLVPGNKQDPLIKKKALWIQRCLRQFCSRLKKSCWRDDK